MSPKEGVKVSRYSDRLKRLETESGIPVKDIYSPKDIEGLNYGRDLGNPGEYPYTRGPYKGMYRNMLWLKGLVTSCETPRLTNERFKKQIREGQTGLRLNSDVNTHACIDPDHPLGFGEVASNACPHWALPELGETFEGIPFEDVDIELAHGGVHSAFAMFCQLLGVAEKRGENIAKLRGSTINCPIGSHVSHQYHNIPLPLARKLNTDIIEFATRYVPRWHPTVPCIYYPQECGITSVQALSLVLLSATAYCESAIERGLNFDDFAPRLVFSLTGEIDFFETVAKMRAVRRMWARIAKERFQAKNTNSCCVRIALRTAGDTLVAQQPVNNIARITIETMAGIFGGAQSLDSASLDEPFGIPTDEAVTISMNIQHIIAHESGIPLTPDPLGGSYYLEWLTNKLEEEANKLIREIEGMGGIYAAIESGWIDDLFEREKVERQREIEEKIRIIVGVNEYIILKEEEIPIPHYRHDVQKARKETLAKLKKFKQDRNQEKTKESLLFLYEQAKRDENLIRPAIDAFKAEATIGEVIGMIREGQGYSYDFFNMIQRPNFLKF